MATDEENNILKSYYEKWELIGKEVDKYKSRHQLATSQFCRITGIAMNNGLRYSVDEFQDIITGFSPLGRKFAIGLHDHSNAELRFDDIHIPIKSGDDVFRVLKYLRPVAQE